jgi:CheY-like chemotaxis protein
MTADTPERPIVVIEDSDEDFEVTVWALREAGAINPVHRCKNMAAIERLMADRRGWQAPGGRAFPVLLLFDLNVPGMDFVETLHALRANPWWKTVPIVVISTSVQPATVSACYAAGVAGYLQKVLDLDAFAAAIGNLVTYWLRTVVPTEPSAERGQSTIALKH